MKRGVRVIIFLGFLVLLTMPLASAGFSDWFKKITGFIPTGDTNVSISVSGAASVVIVVDRRGWSTESFLLSSSYLH